MFDDFGDEDFLDLLEEEIDLLEGFNAAGQVPATHHSGQCELCYYDFVVQSASDHACVCDECVLARCAAGRHDGLLPDGGCEACWLAEK